MKRIYAPLAIALLGWAFAACSGDDDGTFECRGAACVCPSSGDCTVECPGSGDCTARCQPGSVCTIERCSGELITCPGGVQVCNGSCPS